jgi:hypothetical protein
MDHSHFNARHSRATTTHAHSVGKGVALGDLTAAAHPARQRCNSAAAPLAATMSAACACTACAVKRSSSVLSRARSSAIRAMRLCRSCRSTSRVTGFRAALLCRSNVLYSTLTFFSRVRSAAISPISCIDFPPSPALVAILMTTKRRRLDRSAAGALLRMGRAAKVARMAAMKLGSLCGGPANLNPRLFRLLLLNEGSLGRCISHRSQPALGQLEIEVGQCCSYPVATSLKQRKISIWSANFGRRYMG